MPEPDGATLSSRESIAADLRAILGKTAVLSSRVELRPYECDGLSAYRQPPLVVALPKDTAEVSAALRYCHGKGLKVVARGAGTGLSGGALPLSDGVLLGLARLNRILTIDLENRALRAQPGVTNLAISQAVASHGLYYAPDPSSQVACTIGGNVAENSGGVHCLKYGMTVHNVLGLEVVLMDGTILRIGGSVLDTPGYDLLGVLHGSEGLLGVITEVTVRLLPKPPVARAFLLGFDSIEAGGDCVSRILAGGIVPGGLEMMDRLAIRAAEAYSHAGYPLDVEALLLVELDGCQSEVDELEACIRAFGQASGAISWRASSSEAERLQLWAGRKAAFPAVGRLAPDYYCMDGTIPRRHLAKVLRRIGELSEKHGLAVANVFHAGDGNLHPLILYDANRPGDLERAEEFGAEILRLCVEVGGVLTGEHGVGVEKRDLMPAMFSSIDLAQQQGVKCAFDPNLLLNPGKMFPELHRCSELGRVHVHGGALPHPELPRF